MYVILIAGRGSGWVVDLNIFVRPNDVQHTLADKDFECVVFQFCWNSTMIYIIYIHISIYIK